MPEKPPLQQLIYDKMQVVGASHYIRNNVDSVRDELALMVSGASVPAKIQEYAATSQNLKTKEENFSAMVVYGFLSYENGTVSILNKELMDKFADILFDSQSPK